MKAFDYVTARTFQKRLDEKMKELEAEFGIKIEVANAKYDGTEFTGWLKATATDAKKAEFARWAPHFGLEPDDLGRTTLFLGKHYEITGIAPNADKYNIEVKRVRDGKPFRLTASSVKAGIIRKAAA